jgi:hypothetical protein
LFQAAVIVLGLLAFLQAAWIGAAFFSGRRGERARTGLRVGNRLGGHE